ncbi:hypothetical protein [Alcaligenes endophyticus]|uniref:Uncharacterized protein n=1 Tax=Alcaligenes endophyticus TaxID=1929088 RepID=A0ABT8EIM8_9BURK|nr:hypothetical protein [Alcaligenes endophyticus]MCX5592414.1 hypothetical protein [Alcaligenes endophyticus]MDN4121139.1 hypothetical protein [Alcaligenes endophyticus]
MLELQPRERAYLLEIRALAKDQNNNLVFVGMTANDSLWYSKYLAESFKGTVDRNDDGQARYLSLHDQHEEARRTLLASESLMQSTPAVTEQAAH